MKSYRFIVWYCALTLVALLAAFGWQPSHAQSQAQQVAQIKLLTQRITEIVIAQNKLKDEVASMREKNRLLTLFAIDAECRLNMATSALRDVSLATDARPAMVELIKNVSCDGVSSPPTKPVAD
jgi:cell division protein FtsB